ncbi:MAG: YggT family protein [Bacteriovoracaceae bacterium]|nr:YggT family protein [Bacteriovoracaceae bacterium]
MIRIIIDVYVFLLIVDAILSYMPQFKGHPAVLNIRKAADFTCAPVRKFLPSDLPFDASPLVVIILLKLFVLLF